MMASCAYGFGQHNANLSVYNRKMTFKVLFIALYILKVHDTYMFPALLRRPGLLQDYDQLDESFDPPSISQNFYSEAFSDHLLCHAGNHLELHGRDFLLVRLSMHTDTARLGQNNPWNMYQYPQELVRQCWLLDCHGLHHSGAANAHPIQIASPIKPKGGADVCVCTRSLVIMTFPSWMFTANSR